MSRGTEAHLGDDGVTIVRFDPVRDLASWCGLNVISTCSSQITHQRSFSSTAEILLPR